MLALILGCTGQDGSLLAGSLLRQGVDVIGVSRSGNPNRAIHRALGIADHFPVVTADLCDFRSMLELLGTTGPEEIYNLAAQSSVGLSFRQPADTFHSIVCGTVNLLEVARFATYDGRLYFAGSSEMFGDTEKPAGTDSRRRPRSPYGIAKDASFATVALYRRAYGPSCVSGVLFNHESPYRPATYVTRKIVEGALRCRREPAFRLALGDLAVARDWGWAEDYVEAMQLVLRAEPLRDEVICTGRSVTLEYFVDRTFRSLGLAWQDHVEARAELRRPDEILRSSGDPEPMAAHHGWRAKHDVDGVIEALPAAARDR